MLLVVGLGGCRANVGLEPAGVPMIPVAVPLSESIVPVSGGMTLPGSTPGPGVPGPTDWVGTPEESPESVRPKLGQIYQRNARSAELERNPLIVIPGVLGSRLVDDATRRIVWGEFGGQGIDPSSPNGARLLGLPMAEGVRLNDLQDQVHPQGVLDALEIRVFGVPFEMNAYRDILSALGVGGYNESGPGSEGFRHGGKTQNSFQFAYDWRRDNVENAQRLHQFILGKKAEIEAQRRAQFGDPVSPVKFDIVAHSMGGLVARYYLQYGDADLPVDGAAPRLTWAGAEHVERVVLVGTPNAGSIDAVENLVKGVVFSQALPRYQSSILGTMPGLYQLLPRSRHRPVISRQERTPVDILDPRVWARYRWGLLNPDQEGFVRHLLPQVASPADRQRIAYDHLAKCLSRARAFQAALDMRGQPPHGTTLHLIAGDAYPTSAQLWVEADGSVSLASRLPGDGKVTRASALMDERYAEGVGWSPRLVSPIKWESVNFLFTDHLGLTRDPAFTDNVLFLLLEAPRD